MLHLRARLRFGTFWLYSLLFLTVAPVAHADLGTALDAPSLVWTTGGDAPWAATTDYDYNGIQSSMGRSGVITNTQASTLQTTVTGPGKLIFWWKVSCQTNVDYLAWLLNGVEQGRISGTNSLTWGKWLSVTNYLGSGAQSLQWVYTKGASGSAGQDAGWLDHVSYTPGPFPPVITAQPAAANVVPGTPASVSVQVSGAPPFAYQWQFNGVDLPGATSSSLSFAPARVADSGLYRVAVSNVYGSVLSSNALLNVFTSVGPAQPQDALDRWYFRSALQPTRVCFAGGLFFGLGANGLLATSPDGAVWTVRNSGTTTNLTGVACATLLSPSPHSLFVVVGSAGTILFSQDGQTWCPFSALGFPPPPTTQDLNDVAWNGSQFVATATATTSLQRNVFYSANGTNWTGTKFASNPDTGLPLTTARLGVVGGYFITTAGSQFAYYIWRSANGSTWQDVGFADAWGCSIASGNSRTVVVGWEGWPRVSSDQGASWAVSSSPNITPNAYQPPNYMTPAVGSDIAFGNGTFLVARDGLQNGFLTTPDGGSWTNRYLFLGASMESVAFGNGTFVGVCSGGAYPAGIYQSASVTTPFLTLGRQSNPAAVTLSISGELNRGYRLQTSSDLQHWSDRLTYTNSAGSFQWADPIGSDATPLFYRVVSP